MLKINLLPARVIEVRRVRSLAKLLVLVVLVEVIVLSAGVYSLAQKEQQSVMKYENAHARAEEVRDLENQVAEQERATKPFKAKLDWYEDIYKHHKKISETLEKINEYIFVKLTVRQLKLSGSSVNLNAATKDIDHVAKAYFNLLRSRNIVPGTVQMSIGKGGGGGAARGGSGGGSNPNEAMAVQFSFVLLPQYSIAAGGSAKGGGTRGGSRGTGGGARRGRGMGARMGRGR